MNNTQTLTLKYSGTPVDDELIRLVCDADIFKTDMSLRMIRSIVMIEVKP